MSKGTGQVISGMKYYYSFISISFLKQQRKKSTELTHQKSCH